MESDYSFSIACSEERDYIAVQKYVYLVFTRPEESGRADAGRGKAGLRRTPEISVCYDGITLRLSGCLRRR